MHLDPRRLRLFALLFVLVATGSLSVLFADRFGPVAEPVQQVDAASNRPTDDRGPSASPSDPAPESDALLLTPSGVPVEVLSTNATGATVRSPCGDAVEVTGASRVPRPTVVLDPGHGGPLDTGAVGPNGLVESVLNLQVARAAADELASRGIPTALTRTGDYTLRLSVRAAFADASGAAVFVSIHHNSPASAASFEPGTEVYVQTDAPASSRLGGLLYEDIVTTLSQFKVAWTRAHDSGVLRVQRADGTDIYGIIRRPTTPTALVELGYLANGPEAELFSSEAYVRAAAGAIADGIERFLETEDPGRGFVPEPRVFRPSISSAEYSCIDPPLQ